MTKMTVGKCLLESILEKSQLTQIDISRMTGITKQEINSYVRNRRTMSLATAKTIANALNCTIDDLYEWP